MASRSFYVTIPTPAVPVDLAAVPVAAPALTNIDPKALTDAFGTLLFQSLKANTNDVLVSAKQDAGLGSAAPMSATVAPFYGFRVDPADTAPPIAVRRGQGAALRLGDFAILGTAGETLLIFAVED